MKSNNLDPLRSEKEEAECKRDQTQWQANRYANQMRKKSSRNCLEFVLANNINLCKPLCISLRPCDSSCPDFLCTG